MPLSKEDALNLRDGDVVLVPVRIERTNDHFNTGSGVKLVCDSPEFAWSRAERVEGPRQIDIYSRNIHSVLRREVRVGDWVAWEDSPERPETGKVIFLDGVEATIKQRTQCTPRNSVKLLNALKRIPSPALSEAERQFFKVQ